MKKLRCYHRPRKQHCHTDDIPWWYLHWPRYVTWLDGTWENVFIVWWFWWWFWCTVSNSLLASYFTMMKLSSSIEHFLNCKCVIIWLLRSDWSELRKIKISELSSFLASSIWSGITLHPFVSPTIEPSSPAKRWRHPTVKSHQVWQRCSFFIHDVDSSNIHQYQSHIGSNIGWEWPI